MNNLLKTLEYVQGAVASVDRGLKNFIAASPQLVRQHIEQLARQRLHMTRENYLGAVSTKMTEYVLLVELDPENWLANAVEEGVDPFDMKRMLNTSSKVRISKKGFRYLRIPMGKQKGGSGGLSEYGQQLQEKINQVLNKPKFGMKKLKAQINGSVFESKQVLSSDPMLKGLYMTRKFDSIAAYHDKAQRPAWQAVLFRTMSDNPAARSRFIHPGIKPASIFRDTEQWLVANMPDLLDTFIKTELETFNRRFEQGI